MKQLLVVALLLVPFPALAQEPSAVDRWLEDLSSPDFEIREEASKALAGLDDRWVERLEAALAEAGDLEVAERLRRILADLRYPNLVGLWVGEIDGNEFTVVIASQEGRRAIGANTCHWKSGPLTCGLESAESGQEGIVYLDEPRDGAGTGRYVCHIAADGSEMSGAWAYYSSSDGYDWSLRRASRTASPEDLGSWLESDRIGTRCSAVHAIALLDPATARPLLEKALQDAEPIVRQEAQAMLDRLED